MKHNNITIKDILEERLGKDKAIKVLGQINEVVSNGKRGAELENYFSELLANEGFEAGDIKTATTHVVPTT